MIFLLDHCVWKETENILAKAGFKCISLRQLDETEAANGKIISIAKTKKAILVTRDRDFSNLSLYPPGSHEGIVLLRITPETANQVHEVLINTLRSLTFEQLRGNLLVITSTTYRIHKAK